MAVYNIINTITDIHCDCKLFKLGRNTSIVIILGILSIRHYLDWISQRSAEVWGMSGTFVIKRKER